MRIDYTSTEGIGIEVSPDTPLPVTVLGGSDEDGKFGRVEGIDVSPADFPCDIWAPADDGLTGRIATKTFLTSPTTFYIASSEAADTSLSVTLIYHDANNERQTQEFTTDASDGRTAVSTGLSMLDCNRAFLSGDNQTNAGNIFIVAGSAFTLGIPDTLSQIQAMIPAGYGQTQQTMDRVPAGKKMRIKRNIIYLGRGSGAAGSAGVYIRYKPSGGSWRVIRDYIVTDGSPINKPVAGLVFNAGDIVAFRLQEVSDADTTVFAEYHYDLVDV